MTWPDAFALVGVAIALALMFAAIAWAGAREAPPSRGRDEPVRWEYKRTEYRPRPAQWKHTTTRKVEDDE